MEAEQPGRNFHLLDVAVNAPVGQREKPNLLDLIVVQTTIKFTTIRVGALRER